MESLDDIELFGNENNADYQRLEVFFLPCNYIHTEPGYGADTISEECIPD